MIKQVDFSSLNSAAIFIKDLVELEKAEIKSIVWGAGRTKIILLIPHIEEHQLHVTIPYYTPSMVLEAISDPPALD